MFLELHLWLPFVIFEVINLRIKVEYAREKRHLELLKIAVTAKNNIK